MFTQFPRAALAISYYPNLYCVETQLGVSIFQEWDQIGISQYLEYF